MDGKEKAVSGIASFSWEVGRTASDAGEVEAEAREEEEDGCEADTGG